MLNDRSSSWILKEYNLYSPTKTFSSLFLFSSLFAFTSKFREFPKRDISWDIFLSTIKLKSSAFSWYVIIKEFSLYFWIGIFFFSKPSKIVSNLPSSFDIRKQGKTGVFLRNSSTSKSFSFPEVWVLDLILSGSIGLGVESTGPASLSTVSILNKYIYGQI